MDQTTITNPPSRSQGARNFFFYFLMFALLYIVAVSLGGVLFHIINRIFPAVGYYSSAEPLRVSLSALIIGSPIFLWLSRKVYNLEHADQLMQQSGIRRWLTYITLIAAALIVIGDLITLVNYLLGGETTIRFILKALVVLAISGSIFYYYLSDVKESRHADSTKPSLLPKYYFLGTSIIALIVIVSGFFFIESPLVQRQRSQDDVRIRNLTDIQNVINNYALNNDGKLPASLAELTLVEGTANDPITKEPYRYEVVDAKKYRLCATFETSNLQINPNGDSTYPSGSGWLHDARLTCFEQTVNPEQYPKGAPYPVVPVPVTP